MKNLAQAVLAAALMAAVSILLRMTVRTVAPAWEAYPPPNAEEAIFFVVPLVIGGYVSARVLARDSIPAAAGAGFLFMTVVAVVQGARPWWLATAAGALFALFAICGALLARWPRRAV